MEMTLEQQRAIALARARLRAQQQATPEAPSDPTEGMSRTEWALANIGAGMSDLGLGVRQLYTDLTGSEEDKRRIKAEVEEKRRLDDKLAGGAGGKVLQFAGGVAPTLAIPAAPVATGAGLLTKTLAGIGTGVGYGAISPVGEGSNESRGKNMTIGGAFGAALPLSIAGVGAATRPFRGESRAAQEIAEAVVPQGASPEVRRSVLRQAVQQVRPAAAQAADDIPLSMSARLSNPELARLEAGSRTRNGANWYEFDQNQARAVADKFDRATAEAAELEARRGARSANWNRNWGEAQTAADVAKFSAEVPRLRANIDQALLSSEASNPAVRNMLQAIADDIDRVTSAGAQYTPGHLQQIRANLSAKFSPMNPNAFAGAPRDSTARLSVMRDIDDILNNVTGGRWSNVTSNYASDSRLVDAAKGAGRVRGAYYDQATGRVLGVAADPDGAIPKITEAGLGRAMSAARAPDGTTTLSQPASQELEAILAALRRQGIVQGVKRSATAGGGSNTASDQVAAGAARAAGDVALDALGGPAAQVGRSLFAGLRNAMDAKKDRALAQALQDEATFVRMLEQQAAKEGTTLDRSEVMRLLRYLKGN